LRVGFLIQCHISNRYLSDLFSREVEFFKICHNYPRFNFFLAGVTYTRPPRHPGIAPSTTITCLSTSTLTTRRFSTVTCSDPILPAFFPPDSSRPGVDRIPVDPACRWNPDP